ncbi:DUF305 domain-containing protein [Stackebrandtia nassauensis]|uniref:DUF305 domain-containing protein n=1 Tax=Stackebrandtia nassauensis (strain DSM 44728 / CIP 108903 / NRRL B-16338 / NBRC 102104 / LLR-40K-21) TaxID=446470 RepID=D3Q7P7_STANL|nr:DUF305 domain-containing protein [Stackebrandtia nassauensis]ADD44389.1 protein of unknown function DUF305 [Stackebrandtia nassauensis DSM 44728]
MRRYLKAAAVLAAVALVATTAWLFVVPEPTPAEDSPEAGFARDMNVHHGQAVAMSMYVYRNGSDSRMRDLAYDIALTQQAQIGMMSGWLDEWGLPPTSTEPPMSWMDHNMPIPDDGLMPGMATQDQLGELYAAKGSEADAIYSELMITHHEYGIHMAKAIRDRTDLPRVDDLAESMVKGQRSEIKALEQYGDRDVADEG